MGGFIHRICIVLLFLSLLLPYRWWRWILRWVSWWILGSITKICLLSHFLYTSKFKSWDILCYTNLHLRRSLKYGLQLSTEVPHRKSIVDRRAWPSRCLVELNIWLQNRHKLICNLISRGSRNVLLLQIHSGYLLFLYPG